MARPSIKTERKEEILNAYEQCIALYGVEGATQKRVAETAGIARPLLRHHVGNNDEMLLEATKRFTNRSVSDMQELIDYPFKNFDEVLQTLFFFNHQDNAKLSDVTIAMALIISAQTNSQVKEIMADWLTGIEKQFCDLVEKFHPKFSKSDIQTCSSGLMGIYFNSDSLIPIVKNEDLAKRSYQSSVKLLSSFNQN